MGLAPSLWPEVYGLVVMEAQVRGIPCITSDSGGLSEANLMPEFVVRTPAYFDVVQQRLYEGLTVREVEDCIGEPERRGLKHQDFAKDEDHPTVREIMERTAKSLKVSTERVRL